MNSRSKAVAARWAMACCGIFLFFSLHAQRDRFNSSDKRFQNKFTYSTQGKEEVLKTWFHYVVSRTEQDSFLVRVFHPEKGQLTMQITFREEKLRQRYGSFREWYDDGRTMTQGSYVNGKRSGEWTHYTFSGWRSTGVYVEGLKQGDWREDVDPSGRFWNQYRYEGGERHGPYIISDSLGTDTGRYEHGRLVAEARASRSDPLRMHKHFPSFGPCGAYALTEEMDTCSQRLLLKYLFKSLHYPDDAFEYDVQGTAEVEFTVEKDGFVSDVVVRRGLCSSIEEECLRVMKKSPRWTPGEIDGKPVRVRFTQTIRFMLQ